MTVGVASLGLGATGVGYRLSYGYGTADLALAAYGVGENGTAAHVLPTRRTARVPARPFVARAPRVPFAHVPSRPKGRAQ